MHHLATHFGRALLCALTLVLVTSVSAATPEKVDGVFRVESVNAGPAVLTGERSLLVRTELKNRPQPGLCLPMEFVRARDADTIEVRVPGGSMVFALRLINCWAPETDSSNLQERKTALAGKEFVQSFCAGCKLLVFVPFDVPTNEPLKLLTFDRVPAWVYVGDEEITLNELTVQKSFASTTKGGKLGK